MEVTLRKKKEVIHRLTAQKRHGSRRAVIEIIFFIFAVGFVSRRIIRFCNVHIPWRESTNAKPAVGLWTSPIPDGESTVGQEIAVHPFLQKIFVAISAHYDVRRLAILRDNLEIISTWQTDVHVCVGTNEPDKMSFFLRNSSVASNFTRHVSLCPIEGLTNPKLLNWRTRESLAVAFASPSKYSAFLFLEDDLFLSWEALLKWQEDTEVLMPHNFLRSFFRYEISPDDGEPYTLDYKEGDLRIVGLQDARSAKISYFVQPGGYTGTYCGMFAATRDQLQKFIESDYWSFVPGRFAFDEGGREDATWKIQYINTPAGWERTGLLPFNAETGGIDQRALIYHRTNNYFGQDYHGPSLKDFDKAVQKEILK